MTEIDKLYDEENNDPIFLFNEKGEEIAFEQIALIPIRENTYAILKPVIPFEGVGEDEGLVFEIKTNNEQEYLALVVDEKVIDDVFDIYFKLVEENEEE
jgi:hypothetical protein